jgi:uncharacterized small protein (DUF1192 family)
MPDSNGKNVDQRLSKDLTRWRKAGDLEDLRRIQWRAVKMAERVAYDPRATRDEVLKASTRITQATTAYLKVLQVGELEERVKALEQAQAQEQRSTNGIIRN